MREMTAEVLVADDPVTLLGSTELAELIARAKSVPRRRARILLHGSPDELMQEMLIVMTRGQYVPPHRNDRSPKSYLLLTGSFVLVTFDQRGAVVKHFRLAAAEPAAPFFARINQATWHMAIPLSAEVAFMETILGPHRGTVFADWAPAPDDGPAARQFLADIFRQCEIPSDPA
jgi:cupin fold WbuC family metalloprotein